MGGVNDTLGGLRIIESVRDFARAVEMIRAPSVSERVPTFLVCLPRPRAGASCSQNRPPIVSRTRFGAPPSVDRFVRWKTSFWSSDLRAASRGRVSVGDEPAGEMFSQPATIVSPRRGPRLRTWASRPRLGRRDYGRDACATVHDFGIIPDAGYLSSLFDLGRSAWRNLLIVSRLPRFMWESS